MNNFEFYNPVRIIFGKGQIEKLPQYISKDSKILLTYGGGSIKKNGVFDQVKKALAGLNILEFGGITPNPQFDTLMEAVELARREKIDFILAVGGGSVIDGTKFIAAAINFEGDPWTILTKRAHIKSATSFGCVQTLPATGSEMNCFAVVSRGNEKISFGSGLLYPKFAVLDPEITYSLPQQQLGNGVVDAFVHTTEQYLTKDIGTPLQDRWAEGILKTLITEGPKVMEIKEYYPARANLMWTATMALNGIIGSGVIHDWSTHMIGHELTALYGIDHARTLALILPALLRNLKQQKRNKLIMFAENVWDIKNGSGDEKIEKAITLTEDFFNSMGVPTKLKVYNILKQDFEKIASLVMKHSGGNNLGEDQNIDEKMIIQILSDAY